MFESCIFSVQSHFLTTPLTSEEKSFQDSFDISQCLQTINVNYLLCIISLLVIKLNEEAEEQVN